MRPRFSMRLLLVAFTILGVVFYLFFVRPTVVAERFVDAVQQHDYEAAKSVLREKDFWFFNVERSNVTPPIDHVYVEILPREWKDMWTCQRRLIIRFSRHEDTGAQHVEWTEDTDATAYINGLEINDLFGPDISALP